jgi:hypothetical protein
MESLCKSCVNVREVVSGTGSRFLLCRLSEVDKLYTKYPPQPVVQCEGHGDAPSDSRTHFTLEVLLDTFVVCRLGADSDVPDWATGEIVSTTRTSDELSIVCSSDNVPEHIQCEWNWRCLRVAGLLDFSMVGLIASLTSTLAGANIALFVCSTFDTDYLFVRQGDLEAAVASLQDAGHTVST